MKDAKGHGSDPRGGVKTPTLHEEANMRARSAGGMSADQIAGHPDFGGRYNTSTVNAVVGDRAAASELARGSQKSAVVPAHAGTITGNQMDAYLRYARGFTGSGAVKEPRKRNVGSEK